MRGVFQQIVVPGLLPSDDLFRLFANSNHGIAEAVQFFKSLGLGGLNEHASRDRPRAGGRVESVILESLREVGNLEPSRLVELSQVNKQLVSNTSVLVLVPQCVEWCQAAGHVIGIEESDLGRVNETFSTKHLDISPRNEED